MSLWCCGVRQAITVNGICFESTKDGLVRVALRPANLFYKIDWAGSTGIFADAASHVYSDDSSKMICIEPFNPESINMLSLPGSGLLGIPSGIAEYLPNLQYLLLRDNNITGSIPSEIGGLTKLLQLDLNRNNITGSIPNNIGGLTNIINLYLHFNNITGSIPSEIGGLTKLQSLHLQGNSLENEIPSAIANLQHLRYMYISGNNFSQADLSAFVDDLWLSRVQLGGNSCDIKLGDNNGLTATAIDQIEGTGIYSGDGLVQAGCTVTY